MRQIFEWIRRFSALDRRVVWGAGAVLLVSAVAALLAPAPQEAVPIALTGEAFQLPETRPRSTAIWLKILRERDPWSLDGKAGQALALDAKDNSWKVVGIVIEADRRYALVSEGGALSRKIKTGDVLPDGAVVTAIQEDRLFYGLGEQEGQRVLYQRQ